MNYMDRLIDIFKDAIKDMSISSDGKKTITKEIDQIYEESKIASAAIKVLTNKFNNQDLDKIKKLLILTCYRMKENEKIILNENEIKELIDLMSKYIPKQIAIRFSKKLPYMHIFTICYMAETISYISKKSNIKEETKKQEKQKRKSYNIM